MKTGRPTDRIAEATPESRRFPANMSFNGKDDYRLSAESLPSPEAGASRHGRLQLLELIESLSERDFTVLRFRVFGFDKIMGKISVILL